MLGYSVRKSKTGRKIVSYGTQASTLDALGKTYSNEVPSYASHGTLSLRLDGREQEKTASERQTRLTRRSFYRCVEDAKEPVWSFPLEAALIKGLCGHYLTCTNPGTNNPRQRNRYIAQIILETANKLRSCKQISSRLQSLKGSTRDERVKRLIEGEYVDEKDVRSLMESQWSMTSPHALPTTECMHMLVVVESKSATYPSLAPEIVLGTGQLKIQLQTLPDSRPYTEALSGMDPTINLTSAEALNLWASFEVCRDNKPYWTSPTNLVPSGTRDGRWIYASSIAAMLWDVISDRLRKDGLHTKWTVLHSIFRATDRDRHTPLAEITFEFELGLPGNRYRNDKFSPSKEEEKRGRRSSRRRQLRRPTQSKPEQLSRKKTDDWPTLPWIDFNVALQQAVETVDGSTDNGNILSNMENSIRQAVTCLESCPTVPYPDRRPMPVASQPQTAMIHEPCQASHAAASYTLQEFTAEIDACTSDQYYLIPDHGHSPTNPLAAYSLTGEFMGYYPVHDY
ncbi:hypothetical protein B0H11DRAFT_1912372 [Mycena galericulata]|nr:hypothetical protein B0H11DRAFT_1912372 [Mycena galericulata]